MRPLSLNAPLCFPLGIDKVISRVYGMQTTSLFQVLNRPTNPVVLRLAVVRLVFPILETEEDEPLLEPLVVV
jgi:hypothetical protein